jgi:hypothetical protein
LEACAPIIVSVSSGLPCLTALVRLAAVQELVVDVGLDQAAGRAGADLALVEREHREALEALS